MVERLSILSERYVVAHLEPSGRESRAHLEHRQLLDAWMARDGDTVEHLLTEHIKATLADLKAQLKVAVGAGDERGEVNVRSAQVARRHPVARGKPVPGQDAELAASDRAGRRCDRGDGHLYADRGRGGARWAGGDPGLRDRRHGLRLRRARLYRARHDDSRGRERLYVQLCRIGRDVRMDRRMEPDPRIFARLLDGCRRLVDRKSTRLNSSH